MIIVEGRLYGVDMGEIPVADPGVSTRIKASFAAEELTMQAALQKARADFEHKGVKGDQVEGAVRSFLESHLPRRYGVGKGEVIDQFGTRSPQLDVIVMNDDQPFVHGRETNGLYLAEGVSAVGEVKSILGSSDLRDILDKGAKIKQLRPQSHSGDMTHTNPSDRVRYLSSTLYFALALEPKLSMDTILKTLSAEPSVPSPAEPGVALSKLDALFILKGGALYHFGDGTGSYRWTLPDGTSAPGWNGSKSDPALVSLFTWLNATMPRVQRWYSIATPYLQA